MGYIFRRIRARGFAVALVVTTALAFGMIAPVAPALADTGNATLSGMVTQSVGGGVKPAEDKSVGTVVSPLSYAYVTALSATGDYMGSARSGVRMVVT